MGLGHTHAALACCGEALALVLFDVGESGIVVRTRPAAIHANGQVHERPNVDIAAHVVARGRGAHGDAKRPMS